MILYGANKNPVDADEFGNLQTKAISSTDLSFKSKRNLAWTWVSDYTAAGAEQVIYLKNISSDKILIVEKLYAGCSANNIFTVSKVTGTAGGASALPNVSLHVGYDGDAEALATGGAAVTGLTIGETLAKFRDRLNEQDNYDFGGALIIAPGAAISVGNSTAADIEINIIGCFEEM